MPAEVKEEYIVPMLDKSLTVLDFLFKHPGFTSIAEISRSLDIAKGTVFRILYTLQLYNFVRKDDNDQYSIGPSFITYGTRLKNDWDILTLTRPILEETAAEIGESANLGIFLDKQVVVLESVTGEEFFIVKNLIPVSPLYCSSMGKIFLSQMSPEEFSAYAEWEDFKARTVSTIVDPKALYEEVQLAKKEGIAYDREEYTYGLSCVGRGVYYKDKLIAAVSLSGPTSRLNHKGMDRIQEAVTNLAHKIEALPEVYKSLR